VGAPASCVEGASCIVVEDAPRCFADGVAPGLCRRDEPRCDEGYQCATGGFFRQCLEALPPGAMCVGNEQAAVCAAGSSCVSDFRTGARRCVLDGAAGGHCRAGAKPCAEGLSCTGDPAAPLALCAPSAALGDACDPAATESACAPPAYCEPTASLQGRCALAPWSVSSPAGAFVDACDGGRRLALAPDQRDDGHPAAPLALPFALPFGGARYDAVWPSTNGYAVLGGAAPRDSATPRIPLPGEGAVVAPFFADLVAGDGASLCARTIDGVGGPRVALTWRAFGLRGRAGSRVDATAVLWSSGVVELQTASRDDGVASPGAPTWAPVAGVQRADGVAWVQTPVAGARLTPR